MTQEKEARYICPIHGEHNATMVVELYNPEIIKNYCMYCLFEAFDKIGIQDMKQIDY